MGYTQFFEIQEANLSSFLEIWPQLVADAQLIADEAKIPLSGGHASDVDMGDGGPPEITAKKIHLNGGESASYEPFILEPKAEWNCCKTQMRPYDLVVCAILLRASQLAKDAIRGRYVRPAGCD